MFPLRDNIPTRRVPYVTLALITASIVAHVLWPHGGLLLLAGNVLALWIFGLTLEDTMGRVRFVAFATLGGLAGAAAHLPVASGVAAAFVCGYLLLYPDARVVTWSLIPTFVGMIEIPAAAVALPWVVLQVAVGMGLAALAGGLVGLALVKLFAREIKETPPRLPAF